MLAALKTVKGVKSVVCLGSKEKGSYDFAITPMENADVRAAVFERVSERGRTLLSLADNSLSLEQVFLRLTEADNSEARRMLGSDQDGLDEDVSEVTEEVEE